MVSKVESRSEDQYLVSWQHWKCTVPSSSSSEKRKTKKKIIEVKRDMLYDI